MAPDVKYRRQSWSTSIY